MTENGCRQCAANTYSGAGASSCTNCPSGKVSAAGSTSVDDCEYGTYQVYINQICLRFRVIMCSLLSSDTI